MNDLPDCMYDYRYEHPEAKIVDTCMDCGKFIYAGEEYYDIQGMIFCEDCMRNYRKNIRDDE